MKILVCIKQVPDIESHFVPGVSGAWFDETGLSFRMNEYDEFAVEEAVRIRERLGGTEVTALSVGPDRVVEAVRKAMAIGCDRGVHVRDAAAPERDPWEISSMIAGYASGKGFDLLLAGMQSSDRGSAQVGVLTAERLGISCVTTAVGITLEGGKAIVERELEGGARAVVSVSLPAMITCQLGLNTPRYPTLPGIMRSKKQEVVALSPEEAGLEKPLSTASGFAPHRAASSGLVLEGAVDELAEKALLLLREKIGVLRKGGAR